MKHLQISRRDQSSTYRDGESDRSIDHPVRYGVVIRLPASEGTINNHNVHSSHLCHKLSFTSFGADLSQVTNPSITSRRLDARFPAPVYPGQSQCISTSGGESIIPPECSLGFFLFVCTSAPFSESLRMWSKSKLRKGSVAQRKR